MIHTVTSVGLNNDKELGVDDRTWAWYPRKDIALSIIKNDKDGRFRGKKKQYKWLVVEEVPPGTNPDLNLNESIWFEWDEGWRELSGVPDELMDVVRKNNLKPFFQAIG